MKTLTFATILLIIFSFLIALYSYSEIDEDIVASHWNSAGEIDNYMPKFIGLFLFPFILIGLYLLFIGIPKVDPFKKNIESFRDSYDKFIFMFFLYIFYVFLLSILVNLGYELNMNLFIIPSLGLLFFCIGLFMKKFKRNWFIGIRTPWTISNEKVWIKTHELGAKLFKILGIIILFSIFFNPEYLVWFILIPTFIITFWLILYSYLEFKKLN